MKKKILKGAAILTIAGLISRCIGFIYKIFLAKTMTPNAMGLYQLVFPVYNVCFTLFASGIQVTVSKMIAEFQEDSSKKTRLLFIAGTVSVTIATILTLFVSNNSVYVARAFVKEPDVAEGLKILSFSFPFCAVTSVINGYFYGIKKSGIPASSQLIEQIVRVGLVFVISCVYSNSYEVSCRLAVTGLLAGEIASCLFNVISLSYEKKNFNICRINNNDSLLSKFAKMSVPLTLNRFVLSLLHSFETIIFPILLMRSGSSHDEALTTLGIINGMTIPFLVFPSAITSSISILLLPTISEAKCNGKLKQCRHATGLVIKYSLILGYTCLGIFTICGNRLCKLIYGNETAGKYLVLLSLLCPMMYFSATVPSILNGLGKPLITFRNSCVLNIIQITLLAIFISILGIKGYFVTMFITQFVQLGLDIYSLRHEKMFRIDAKYSVIIPGLIVGILIPIFSFVLNRISFLVGNILAICITMVLFVLFYMIILFATKVIRRSDFT